MIISEYAYQMSFYKFSQRFVMENKELFLEKLLKTNIKFWSKHTAGDMFKILEDDIAAIENMFTCSISAVISNTFITIGVASYLIYIHRIIGFLFIAFTLIIVLIQRKYGKKLENFVYPLREEVAVFSSYTNEVLNNVTNIEMCGTEKKVYTNYCNKNQGIVKKTLQQLRMVTFLRSIISSYSVCALFAVMIIGAKEVDGGVFNRSQEYWYNKIYTVQCIANRIPVMVKGQKGEFEMFGGTSKATAMMTVKIGNILEDHPNISYDSLQNVLMSSAEREVWDKEETEHLVEYMVKGTSTTNDDEEKKIEAAVVGYLEQKGLVFNTESLRKWGYQSLLQGDDFFKIIDIMEKMFKVKLPCYEGINYRIFDNANSLKQFFKSFV